MSGFGFAAPWMLLAGLAVAVPIIAHLARHEDREGRDFPSLMFLRRIPFPARSRRTLADRWLLALRLCALLALVLAFAQPWLSAANPAAQTPKLARVVLLDRSWSMTGGERFEGARRFVAAQLRVDRSSRVALVAFDDRSQTLSGFDSPAGDALQALSLVQVGNRATNIGKAFAHATRLLGAVDAEAYEVVLISDLQASALEHDASLPGEIGLRVHAVEPRREDNLALLHIWHGGSGAANEDIGGDAQLLHARVLNSGNSPVSTTLRVTADGLRAAEQALELAAGERRTVTVPLLAATDRAVRVQVMLGGEAHDGDNTRRLVIAPLRPVKVLMVHQPQQQAPRRGVQSRDHVEAALLSSQRHASIAAPAVRLQHVEVSRLDAALPDEPDVIVLNGVMPGARETALAIEQALAKGKGVLVLAGGELAGDWSQSSPLVDVVAALPLAAEATVSRLTAFGALWPQHAIGAVLGNAALEGVAVWRYRPLRASGTDRVMLRFDDGAPAWIERVHGAGLSMTWAFPLQMQAGNLVSEPIFAALLLESVRYLAKRPGVRVEHAPGDSVAPLGYSDALVGGATIAESLRSARAVSLRSPSGRVLSIIGDQPQILDEAGWYELRSDNASPLPIAVNIASAEAVPDALSAAQLNERLSRDVPMPRTERRVHEAEASRDSSIARWLLWIAVGGFVCEALCGHLLTRRRWKVEVAT